MTLRCLHARRVLDIPNERSSHVIPTPRGAGIGVLVVLIPAWLGVVWAFGPSGRESLVPLLAVALAMVCWVDDVRRLPAAPRFIAQAIAVGIGVTLLPSPVFTDGGSLLVDRIIAALVWLWFINLFNFMDGIDGITGVSAFAMGLGTFVVLGLNTLDPAGAFQGLAIAAVALGFLLFNWQPARIFLGDVGSIPLGFLLGWLLLNIAASEHWPAALIIPLYYLADSGLTLAARIRRRENVFRAHREHFYQRAVLAGRSHATVATMILATTLALAGLAVASTLLGPAATAPMLVAATVLVGGLLAWMCWPSAGATDSESHR